MLSVEEARDRILAHASLAEADRVTLLEASGRVPALLVVTAAVQVPPFSNSAMDGFAARVADL
ncbi:MAG: molybdopterin molybdotransferase, partial [Chloroflexota bacterium]